MSMATTEVVQVPEMMMHDPYAVLTPFDAEKLLAETPTLAILKPELVQLQQQMDYYLTQCCGLYKEGIRAMFKRDIITLNRLWPYAPQSNDTSAQWQGVIAYIYRHAMDNVDIALLCWLAEKQLLFNVKSFERDLLASTNMDLHRWVATQIANEKRREMDTQFILTSGILEETATVASADDDAERKVDVPHDA
jgi:hypothetical protein